jgi:putative ABC transport system permease protein
VRALIQNLRFAFRQLRKSPGFTAVAVLTLALGIGPNVAIFSIVWATFLAPWPYPDADQLVIVWDHYKGERVPTAGDDYARLAAQSHSFQSLSFESWSVLHLTEADHTPNLEGGLPITPGTNSKTMQQPMLLGRDFLPEEGDPGNDHVVILAHWLWQHRYNSDRNILGKSILINDEPYTVVGVMQTMPHESSGGIEFNVPIRLMPGVHTNQVGAVRGRLKPGVTLAQAQAELSAIKKTLRDPRGGGQDPNAFSVTVEHLRNNWLAVKTQRNLWLLLCAVSLVLLIACANIANLLLARGNSRTQEFAVRSVLGASRGQILVQLFTESLTLALSGGVLGVALGWIIMKLSLVYLPSLAIESSETVVQVNLPVLGFAFMIALLAGIVAGCAPSLRSARVNESEMLKQARRSAGGRGRTPLQAGLVIAEIALALILLAGSGLALRSFWNLSHIDLGFRTDHILTAELWQDDTAKRGSKRTISPAEQVVAQQRQLLERIRTLPGVSDATLVNTIPLHDFDMFPFAVAGIPVDHAHMPQADFQIVTPSYFGTFGIRLVSGRFLNDEDRLQSAPVVMVNEAFVRRYLPSGDPLTHRLLLELPAYASVAGATTKTLITREYQIVGVLHDVLNNEHLTGTVQPAMYVSRWQTPRRFANIAVRTVAIDPATIFGSLQRAVSSAIPGAAIDHVQTMEELLEEQTSPDRFQMILFGAFAGIALLLSAVGIYGVMSFAVTQRTHEIGVRMAMGAPRTDVIRLIVGSGFRMALVGLAIGLAGALALGQLMRSTLYGVRAVDFSSLAAVAVLLLAVALVACWVPARRSAGVDPVVALRDE